MLATLTPYRSWLWKQSLQTGPINWKDSGGIYHFRNAEAVTATCSCAALDVNSVKSLDKEEETPRLRKTHFDKHWTKVLSTRHALNAVRLLRAGSRLRVRGSTVLLRVCSAFCPAMSDLPGNTVPNLALAIKALSGTCQ